MSDIVRAIDVCQSSQGLEHHFKESVGKVHSIKLNSLWHRFEHDYIVNLAKKYEVDLFLDLKLYDTPNTIANYLRELSGKADYLTITCANYNTTSIDQAYKGALDYGIQLFFVSMLSSSNMQDENRVLYLYKLMCATIRSFNFKYNASFGVVIPTNYIYVAKQFGLMTLTPGIVVHKEQLSNYAHQVHVGTLEEARNNGGDLFVLGRNFKDLSL